jgi:hypothetical protein
MHYGCTATSNTGPGPATIRELSVDFEPRDLSRIVAILCEVARQIDAAELQTSHIHYGTVDQN